MCASLYLGNYLVIKIDVYVYPLKVHREMGAGLKYIVIYLNLYCNIGDARMPFEIAID